MTKVYQNTLFELLPFSLREDPVLIAMAEAAEIQLKQAYREAESVFNLVDIDNVPEQLLDLLAYEKHVDFYDSSALPLSQKRNVIKTSVSQHRKKGTPYAVERALSNIGIESQLLEWFEYGGLPYYFSINLNIEDESDKVIRNRIKKIISPTKNTRSWLDKINYRGIVPLQVTSRNQSMLKIHSVAYLNPWAQAGLGSTADDVLLNGEYLLNGDRFLNGFYNKDGPAHLQRIKLVMKVLHGFGVHEINLTPVLDGEFNLDGKILLQNEPQRVRLVMQHETVMRYQQRERISIMTKHVAPSNVKAPAFSGVITLNGQARMDGSIPLNQALYEHSGLFRVKKAGETVEEVAI